MSKGKQYNQKFIIETVKQITEGGCSGIEISARLGLCTKI